MIHMVNTPVAPSTIPSTLAEIQAMTEDERWIFFKRHSGIQGRAAEKAGVHKSLVPKVANGKAVSANVQKALEGELRKLRREENRLAQVAG